MKKQITLLCTLFFYFGTTAQTLRLVPMQYPTIQAGIDAAQPGDSVVVAQGEYFENLRLKGKSIVLTSRYYFTHEAADIANTIINGSQPAHPDSASCILIVDGESPSTVVQGFTITGGTGTKWLDPAGAGVYREGGGILTEGTSPTIQFNIIRNNAVTVTGTGVVSTGGGGIRCGEGAPVIRNNWIHHNEAIGYGGGIVFNYCSGLIANNVVAHNTGGKDFGGGGLWFVGTDQNTVVELLNNTIVENNSTGTGQFGGKGGGLFVFAIKINARNNIFWNNTQSSGGAISQQTNGQVVATFSDIQGGFPGTGNFDLDPLFADTVFYSLRKTSPAVDAADPADNDLTINNIDAKFPSLCRPTGDLGAYGGDGASTLPSGLVPTTRLFQKVTEGPLVSTPSDSRSVNFVDVDNDGHEDIFISNGPQGGALNFLYLNDGTGHFAAAPNSDIVAQAKPFDGATFADFDNDGNLDAMAVTWYGDTNPLYAGNGDGTFTYLPNAAPSIPGTYSETASWGDYDGDGLVDLYLTNSDVNKKNLLFHNSGAGDFEAVTTGPHVNDAKLSRSVNWVDYDGDCDLDLFVTNESNQPDDLYRNEGNGLFTKVTTGAPSQSPYSTMTSSWGDVDNDGDLDLFVGNTNFFAPLNNQLFLNDGDGSFTEVTTGPLVSDGGCSYGSNFADYDNDGDLDLAVSNGFCNGQIVNFLYKNDGLGNFARDLESIENLGTPCSYGTAFGDVNNDGFPDLGFATCKNTSASTLPVNIFYLNEGNCHNWLKIKLEGTLSNRSAIGAKVWATAIIGGQEVTQFREISAQSGYCGQNSLLAHFGLGDAESVSQLRVQFRCGVDTVLTDVPLNQVLEIVEAMPTAAREVPAGEAFSLLVSPNPTSGSFFVELKMRQPADTLHLLMTDASGQVVYEEKVTGQWNVFKEEFTKKNLGLEAGTYFMKATVAGRSVVEQVVVF